MEILTDVDGVLLNWEYAFKVWLKTYKPELKLVNGHHQHYHLSKRYGIEINEEKALVKTFNTSSAIGFLPPLRDAMYYVKRLVEEHGHTFTVITSMSNDPHSVKLREKNLKKLFGEYTFTEFICLGIGDDKDDVLAEYAKKYPDTFWIEDKPENVDIGIKLGLTGILMEHGFNMDYSGDAYLVKDWKQIYEIITNSRSKERL